MTSLTIKDFPNYEITDDGKVFSKHYRGSGWKMELKQHNILGYLHVNLRKNGRTCGKMVHRLVAEAFIPNPENKPQVNHKNGNKTDNRVGNLEWATASENMVHCVEKLSRKKSIHWKGKSGGKHPTSRKVIRITLDGKTTKTYDSISEAAKDNNTSWGNISKCCGKYGRKTCVGYKWKYADDTKPTLEELEQALTNTKKKLDIAVDALKRIADAPIGYCMFAEEALEQITAEQKEQ